MPWEADRLIKSTDSVVDRLYRTVPFQLQRYNLQLGFCDVPYPYESEPRLTQNYWNYPRIAHMKGCYKLATEVVKRSRASGGHIGEMVVACYVHDVGHGHTSHALEGIRGLDHEKRGAEIVRTGQIAEIIGDGGFDPDVVARIFCDELGHYSSFLTSDIGVDRITYVKADSAAIEEAIDVSDVEKYLYVDTDRFYLKGTDLGLPKTMTEYLLGQRAKLISFLYGCPANRAMTTMYRTAFTQGLEEGVVDMDDAMTLILPQQFAKLDGLKDAKARSVHHWLRHWHPFYGVRLDLDEEKAEELRRVRMSDKRTDVEAEIERRVNRGRRGSGCTAMLDVSKMPGKSKLDFMIEDYSHSDEGEILPAKKAIREPIEFLITGSQCEFWTFFDPQTAEAFEHDERTLERHIAAVCGIDVKPPRG